MRPVKPRNGDYNWAEDFLNQLPPDKQTIAARLKDGAVLMAPVYEKMQVLDDTGKHAVLGAIVDSACLYEQKREIKDDLKSLEDVQSKIIKTTRELITLLNLFDKIKASGNLTSEAETRPLDLFRQAGETTGPIERQYLFKNWPAKTLEGLGRFDARYLPSLADLLETFIAEMDVNPTGGAYPEVNAVLDSRKTTHADFIRGLLSMLDMAKRAKQLPSNFTLTNDDLAAIACAAIGAEVDAENVKKARKPKR